jgi:glutaminase
MRALGRGLSLSLGTLLCACTTVGGIGNGGGAAVSVHAAPEPPPGEGVMLAATATTGAAAAAQPRAGRAAQDSIGDALSRAYRDFRDLSEGKNADYIPVLAQVDPNLYGIALVTVSGAVYEVGSSRAEFSIQSVSKPFTLARALEAVGPDVVRDRIGVNATGQKFNSIIAIELNESQKRPPPGNPFVNPGAIATVDLVPASTGAEKWDVIIGVYNAFAGRRLSVNQDVYRSESETNTRNRSIVQLLKAYEVIKGDPAEALDLYTRQCAVSVNARDLAVMGATLANGGRNPVSNQQVVSPTTAAEVLSVMATAGMYDTTGEWMMATGVPAKSGVGGGIVAVVPGRFAIGTFAPPLDEAGNSVRGQRAIQSIVKSLGGGVFASQPTTRRPTAAELAAPPPPASPGLAAARGR